MSYYNDEDNFYLEPVFQGYGEPVWNPIDSITNGWEFTEEEVSLAQPFLQNLTKDTVPGVIRGMEVGDDRVDLSYSKELLEMEITLQSEVLGMKTSLDDTSITKNLWNFTEVTGILPNAKEQSFDYLRKSNNSRYLGFLDCIPLRIIIDTKKGNSTHSNSSVGKAQMLSRYTSASRDEFKESIQLSSFLQDGFLQTVKMTDPKYLPRAMGGCGASSPYGSFMNRYSYVKTFKGGTYERVYGTSTNELRHVINLLEKSQAAEPWFSKRLRDKQEYLHGTYAEKVFVPEERELTSPFWTVPRPLYKEAGTSIGISSVESRLIRNKKLITSSLARTLVTQRDRIVQVLEGLQTVEDLDREKRINSIQDRKGMEGALQANSAFQNLLKRCANDGDVSKLLSNLTMKMVPYGARHFDIDHARWLHHGGKGEILSINDIKESEDVYAYSDISLENSMRIAGIPLDVIFNRSNRAIKMTEKRVGLYEISHSQEEWADKVFNTLRSYQVDGNPIDRETVLDVYSRDLEWVNDDSMLIGIAVRDNLGRPNTSIVVLVSSDKKLAKQMARTINCSVFLYHPSQVIQHLVRESWSSKTKISYGELRSVDRKLPYCKPDNQPLVYIDSGSLMSAASSYEKTSDTSFIRKRELLWTESFPHRRAAYSDTTISLLEGKPMRYDIYHPEIGKPKRTSYDDFRARGPSGSEVSSTLGTRSVNSRAESWGRSDPDLY